MNRIRLSDGTEFAARFCSARGVLTMDIFSETDFVGIAQIFGDAEKTRVIEFLYGDYQDVFEGFTRLILVNVTEEGEYLIALRKGESNGTV